MKKEFVLPKFWAIKQEHEEINDWFNKNKQTLSNYHSIGHQIFHYPIKPGGKVHLYSTVQPGYTEITFEEFEIHVLKTKKYKPVNPSELETIYKRLLQ